MSADTFGEQGRATARETRRVKAFDRFVRAIKLRQAGCTRAQIAVALDMKPEGVKELFKTRRLRSLFRDPTPEELAAARLRWPPAQGIETAKPPRREAGVAREGESPVDDLDNVEGSDAPKGAA